MRTIGAALLVCILGWCGTAAAADALPVPIGPVLLTVSGAIDRTNAPGEARFDRDMLRSLGVATMRTVTPWTDGEKTFEGVPLQAVLDRVGAHGTELHAAALNDYKVTIPADDLAYGLLLAMSVDGRLLSRRDKGPLWVIYPRDGFGVIQNYRTESRSIWQLHRIRVQ